MILIVADSSRKILVDPDSGRKIQEVTEWKWKILNVGDSFRKILLDPGS